MFLFFFGLTLINFVPLAFNALLFLTIHIRRDKTRISTVYVYNLLIGNSGHIITLFFTFFLPMCLDDDSYTEFRSSLGPILTLLCSFCYEHPLYLTVLMVVHRIYAIFDPMNRIFTENKLWLYCGVISLLSLISLLIPFFSDCTVNINQRTFSFSAACPERHPVTNIENRYLIVIPVISVMMNIGLILYLATRKASIFRKFHANKISVISISSNHQLPPIRKPRNRQNFEKTLLDQSISTSIFLVIYELSGILLASVHLSEDVRRFIFYSRISASSFLCFFVYFIGTPSIRELIIASLLNFYRGKREKFSALV